MDGIGYASANADTFVNAKIIDAYENRTLISCPTDHGAEGDCFGTYNSDKNSKMGSENRNLGKTDDPNSEFNKQAMVYYMNN